MPEQCVRFTVCIEPTDGWPYYARILTRTGTSMIGYYADMRATFEAVYAAYGSDAEYVLPEQFAVLAGETAQALPPRRADETWSAWLWRVKGEGAHG